MSNAVRSPISQALRKQVLERDSFTCQYCGANHLEKLEIDHVHPVRLGGDNGIENLATACQKCNSFKAGRPYGYGGLRFLSKREIGIAQAVRALVPSAQPLGKLIYEASALSEPDLDQLVAFAEFLRQRNGTQRPPYIPGFELVEHPVAGNPEQ